MAFFCPMRIRRRRRKRYREDEQKYSYRNGNAKGRITGSNSVDSLVEIGKDEEDNEMEFEPRKMVVLHDFIPCVEDEVPVKRGQHVKALYQETDWIYVLTNDGKEGFIPFTYCVPEEEYEKRKEKQKGIQRNNFRNASFLDSLQIQTDALTPALNFKKNNYGDYVVKFDFVACDENDINAQKGEVVQVLNKDDQDWYWVVNSSGIEGFIPKDFLTPYENSKLQNGDVSFSSNQALLSNSRSSSELQVSPLSRQFGTPYKETSPDLTVIRSVSSGDQPYASISPTQKGSSPITLLDQKEGSRPRRNTNELLLYGQELVCTDTYVAKRVDELTVYKGDWIYADMKHKDSRGWIWAYSPSNKTQGYVPKSCLRPPATTPL